MKPVAPSTAIYFTAVQSTDLNLDTTGSTHSCHKMDFQRVVSQLKNRTRRLLEQRRFAISAAFFTSLWLAVFATGLHADHPNPTASLAGPAVALPQVPPQFSDAPRLLGIVERQLELGNQDLAFDALLAIFSTSDADLPIMNQKDPHTTAYDKGLATLQAANIQLRSAWSKKVEPVAWAEMQRSGQTSTELQLIARKYPFTQSGLQASILLIRNMVSHRQNLTATAAVQRLQEQYSGVPVNFPAQALLTMTAREVERQSHGHSLPQMIASELGKTTNPLAAISSWQPIWKFQEDVWNTPQIAGTFNGLSQLGARSALASNSWQPFIDENQIILRTPVRIVSLNLHTGLEQWSIPTDTVTQDPYATLIIKNIQAPTSGQLSQVLRNNDLGAVTYDGNFLFFVDHFRIFESDRDVRNILNRNILNRNIPNQRINQAAQPLSRKGARLVAVRMTNPPTIAWTTGINNGFRYQPSSPVPNSTRQQTDQLHSNHSAAQPEDPESEETDPSPNNAFHEHRFLGPPLVFEQSVFVLTAHKEDIWLNSLIKGTGRLSWRRLMPHKSSLDHDPRRRFRVQSEDIGASVVGIHNDTILSLLNTGSVVGTSLPDGRLKWSTSLKDNSTGQSKFELLGNYSRSTVSLPSFPPILHKGRLIWIAAGSNHLSCLNASTGAIQWKTTRFSTKTGQTDLSKDLLPAGIVNDQLIMTGERHVRAVNISDGSVAWTTGLNHPIGKAVLIDNTCWVPTLNGSIVPVDVASGELGTPISSNHMITGSLYHSQNRILAITPISVQALPLFQNLDHSHNTHANPDALTKSNTMQQTIANAFNTIQKFNQSSQGDDDLRSLTTDLVDLSDQQQQLVAEHILNAAFAHNQLQPAVKSLSELPITKSQSIRQQILLEQTPRADTELIPLTNDWRIRSDLAPLAHDQEIPLSFATSNIKEIIQQPEHLQAFSRKQSGISLQDLAQNLKGNHPAAAELALLMEASAQPEDTQILNLLQALRNQSRNPIDKAQLQETNQSNSIWNSEKLKFEVEQDFHLATVTPMTQLTGMSRQPIKIPTPSPWHGQRLFLQEQKLFSANLNHGTITKPLTLPGTPDRITQIRTPLAPLTPSLLPIIGTSHVGMISLINQAEPKELWWKRWDRAAYDSSPLRSGPVTTSGAIFATKHRITCLHPLTGATLWRQNFTRDNMRIGYALQVAFAADNEHLIALSSGYRSGTVFRMADGKQLATLGYDIPEQGIPMISGSRLLYPQQDRLKLIDLVTGDDLIEDLKIDIRPKSRAQLLSNTRALITTKDNGIAVLNLKTARLEFSAKMPAEVMKVMKQRSLSMQSIEHNDRILILIKQWTTRNRELSATSVVGDHRLTSGTLVSMDPTTGKSWSIQIPTTVLMEIAGDPVPLLMLWSRRIHRKTPPRGLNQQRISVANREDNLVLRIVDQQTGQELFRADKLGWGNPLRCFHDSESQTITIETDASDIRLRYTESDSDPE